MGALGAPLVPLRSIADVPATVALGSPVWLDTTDSFTGRRLHRLVLVAVRDDAVCRRLMTVPGVGPVTALTVCSAVDDPARFNRSRAVGAHFGLTPRRYQSGETDRVGHISKQGDGLARQALYEAANVLLTRTSKWSALKAWGMGIAKRAGMRRAKVAVARKLAVIMHRMWLDGSEFRFSAAEPSEERPVDGGAAALACAI